MNEESLFDESEELVDELLEEAADEAVDSAIDDTSQVGETSEEGSSRKLGFNVYDGMMFLSLICVTLATLFVVFALRKFGNFPFEFPWL